MPSAVFGGIIAAQIHHVASTHMVTDPVLKPLNQPDIMTMHIQFLRQCVVQESTVVITVLKSGKSACNLQLELYQNGVLNVFALATTTNFDVVFGPSPSILPKLHPVPFPKPDLSRIEAGHADGSWIPAAFGGDLMSGVFRETLVARPRSDYDDPLCSDAWHSFRNGATIDATRLALLGDFIHGLSATLRATGGAGDDNAFLRDVRSSYEKSPGAVAVSEVSIADVMKRTDMEQTMSLSYEFKRRLPREGVRWVLKRIQTGLMENGRADANVSILDEDGKLLMTCRHSILVLEIGRKFVAPKASL